MHLPRTITAVVAFALGSLVVPAPIGCSSDEGTTGKRVAFDFAVAGSPAAKSAFTNAQGWSVTLERAALSTGNMTFFDGATIFSQATPAWSFAGRAAFAHPGHYVAGEARGEVRASSSVDLRTGGVVGRGGGVSGIVRSATFSFGVPPQGPLAGELAGSVAVLEGTARKGAETRLFRAAISAEDVKDTKGAPIIEGCPFVEADVQSDGRVSLTVKVETWFDEVDFAELAPSGDGKPVTLPPGSLARNTLVRGMKAGTAYVFTWEARK